MTIISVDKNEQQPNAKQLAIEVELLKSFDPDEELKKEFETASLHDLQKNEQAS
ncbi:hypothetical protein [Mucilaginibacter sp.]|uniref:hypothetical protein n=1 Tax=Mucilaginibacter sp. TaxID=1882438 RepID=UPI0026117A08|nr:hypothetical protein [Mucilaginibacter sp.]MDB4918886.1 hypothetical protein [Mucilaginibacter sp.]